MTSFEYNLGFIDTMVKSGEMSYPYACGLVSGLKKSAMLYTTDNEKYQKAWNDWTASHADRRMPGGRYNITPKEAIGIVDGLGTRNTWNWWDRKISRLGNAIGGFFDLGHTGRNGPWYDRWDTHSANHARDGYMREMMHNGVKYAPELLYAVQKQHMADAENRWQDMYETSSPAEMKNSPYGTDREAFKEKYRLTGYPPYVGRKPVQPPYSTHDQNDMPISNGSATYERGFRDIY